MKNNLIKNKIADLHIHSYYSDGTMSPEEILEKAIEKNMGLIAITDHDTLDGTKKLLDYINNEIICISGIELDAVEFGINYHILGYGMNLKCEEFQKFVITNRKLLEEVNIKINL